MRPADFPDEVRIRPLVMDPIRDQFGQDDQGALNLFFPAGLPGDPGVADRRRNLGVGFGPRVLRLGVDPGRLQVVEALPEFVFPGEHPVPGIRRFGIGRRIIGV